MAFNEAGFSVKRYEVTCIGTTTTPLTTGIAVKLDSIGSGKVAPGYYPSVSVAGKGDDVFGVVSTPITTRITNALTGQGPVALLMVGGTIPVLMNKTAMKGDLIFVATADGKWEKAATGDRAQAQLIEDVAAAGDLAWAVPLDRVV